MCVCVCVCIVYSDFSRTCLQWTQAPVWGGGGRGIQRHTVRNIEKLQFSHYGPAATLLSLHIAHTESPCGLLVMCVRMCVQVCVKAVVSVCHSDTHKISILAQFEKEICGRSVDRSVITAVWKLPKRPVHIVYCLSCTDIQEIVQILPRKQFKPTFPLRIVGNTHLYTAAHVYIIYIYIYIYICTIAHCTFISLRNFLKKICFLKTKYVTLKHNHIDLRHPHVTLSFSSVYYSTCLFVKTAL